MFLDVNRHIERATQGRTVALAESRHIPGVAQLTFVGRQTALVASSSVGVQNTLASHRVDHALGSLEGCLSGGLVAGEDQLAHLLDGGAVLAALSRKVLVAGNRLTGALNAKSFVMGKINMARLASTRMLCPDSPYEAPFLQALGRVSSLRINNNHMCLTDSAGHTLITLTKE